MWKPPEERPSTGAGRIIYFTPYPDYTSRWIQNEPHKLIFAKTWDEVQALLACRGTGTKVSILSDGTISRFA